MKKHLPKFSLLLLILGIIWGFTDLSAQTLTGKYDKYLSPNDLNEALKSLNSKFPKNTRLHVLAESPGKQKLSLLEIGPEIGKEKKSMPAVLVVANLEGNIPISSMAAVYLADHLLNTSASADELTWYILPCGNPDGLNHYFSKPLNFDTRNAKPVNDDMDDQVDEDGVNDLNGDGFITQMRVKDPQGTMLIMSNDKRMMRKANPLKEEQGMYKIYSEGIDDDGDGTYNEDGLGGINVGLNYPHLFQHFKPTTGLWPGCTDESFQIIKFVFEHPEIAMTMSYGATNFCMVPPKGGRQSGADMDKIKVPESMANMINADPNKEYSIKEIMEMVQPLLPPGMEVTESMIASFLGLGAVVNPLQEDLAFYKELSEKYKKYLEDKGMKEERLEPASAKDGSFELWSYYHLGVPSFTMDLWTLPKVKEEKKEQSGITIEKLESMTSEEFIELGEEKINAFLKESGAPDQYKASSVIAMIKGGSVTPKQMAQMMKSMPKPKDESGGDPKTKALLAFSDKYLDGKGFIEWKTFNHPDLGEVEIGGAVAYSDNTPPAEFLDSLLSIQVPWVVELSKKLPKLAILESKVKDRGNGVYDLEIWVENKSFLPFPTAMGKRNMQPAPAIIEIQNATLLSGKKRTAISALNGFERRKLTWVLQTTKSESVNVKLTSVNAWGDQTQIEIGGTK